MISDEIDKAYVAGCIDCDGTNELSQLMYERMRLLKNTEPEEGVLLYS